MQRIKDSKDGCGIGKTRFNRDLLWSVRSVWDVSVSRETLSGEITDVFYLKEKKKKKKTGVGNAQQASQDEKDICLCKQLCAYVLWLLKIKEVGWQNGNVGTWVSGKNMEMHKLGLAKCSAFFWAFESLLDSKTTSPRKSCMLVESFRVTQLDKESIYSVITI